VPAWSISAVTRLMAPSSVVPGVVTIRSTPVALEAGVEVIE
jgi:hypothetical protein